MQKETLKTSDFYYDLPERLIAQTPVYPRDSSRLLCYNKQTDTVEHKHFYDIENMLNAGDVLVINDTKVYPARSIHGLLGEEGSVVFRNSKSPIIIFDFHGTILCVLFVRNKA